jgi:AcrR family transcriptional regulator
VETVDRRVKRTHNLLANALIELTLEKGYDAVTIQEITKRADVGYATFFRHYRDKDGLLADVLEVVLDELMERLLPPDVNHQGAELGKILFGYVAEHKEVVQVLLSSRGSSNLLGRVVERGTANALQKNQPNPASSIPPEIAAYHLVTSTIALLQWWLEHEMSYSVERMGEIYRDLVVQPTIRLAFI